METNEKEEETKKEFTENEREIINHLIKRWLKEPEKEQQDPDYDALLNLIGMCRKIAISKEELIEKVICNITNTINHIKNYREIISIKKEEYSSHKGTQQELIYQKEYMDSIRGLNRGEALLKRISATYFGGCMKILKDAGFSVEKSIDLSTDYSSMAEEEEKIGKEGEKPDDKP